MIEKLLEGIEIIIIILIGVAFITLAERKVLGAMQRREGPNIIGIYGILQPLIDGFKLILKEIIIPYHADKFNYIIGPIMTLTLSLIIWIVFPLSNIFTGGFYSDNNLGLLFILVISTISGFLLLFTGWSSNSKYTFIGSIRAIAQLISYEVSLGIILIGVLFYSESFNLITICYKQIYCPFCFLLFPSFILFFLSALAETNRPPFDLPEAESELVAGILTEYSGFGFTSLYLAEYAFLYSMSLLTSILFFGSSLFSFFFIFFFIWIRASLPRVRYDQLMALCWTSFLPLSISYLFFLFSSLFCFF